MKSCKRIAAWLLAAVLLLAALPVYADGVDEIKAGDVICFGTPDEKCGFDGKWLVLDAAHTNTGADGMFLLSLNLIGGEDGNVLLFRDIGDVTVSFSDRGETFAAAHPGATDYQGSDIQSWCEAFLSTHFTEAEQGALLPTDASDDAIVIPGFSIPLPGAANGTVDFDPAENVLQGDRLFIPSVAELTSEAYGFTENKARVAQYRGTDAGYWLRSPHIPTFPLDVGFVFPFGAVMDYPVNARSMFEMTTYARPACNLDAAAITGVEKLSEENGVTVWRVSVRGEANDRVYDTTLPVIGEVMDLGRSFLIIVIVVLAVLLLLVALVVFLIVRGVKRRRAKGRAQ